MSRPLQRALRPAALGALLAAFGSALAGAVVCASIGCVSTMECRDSVDLAAGNECVVQGGPAEAVGTAAAAGVVWGVAGCRVNGCRPPYTCDHDTGYCEPATCSEGHPCPPGYTCDDRAGRCE